MGNHKTQPGVWCYGFPALVLMLGCLITIMVVYRWLPNLSKAVEAELGLNNLMQVVVPGSKDIIFNESGAYAVYYEYRSVVADTVYAGSKVPPNLICTLTSTVTGADIGIAPDYVETNTYSTKNRERVGVLIFSITINQPGAYTFSCRYTDGKTQPEIVLAVGPNFVWEFFGLAAKSGSALATGVVVFLGSSLVATVITIIVALKRHQSKQITTTNALNEGRK